MARKRAIWVLFGLLFISLLVQLPVVKSALGKFAFKLALNPTIGNLVGISFEYAAPLLPVNKQILQPGAIAFNHPRPA